MKASLDRHEFADALKWVDTSVGQGFTPAAASILLTAAEGRLMLIATDLDNYAITTIPAKVDEPGEALVPRRLAKVAAKLPDAPVTLSLDDRLRVTCGRTKASVGVMDADHFPRVPEVDGPEVVLPAEVVAFASAHMPTRNNPERPFLGGIHVKVEGGTAAIQATDEFRAHRLTIEADGEGEAILDPRLLGASFDGKVTLTIGDKAASLSDGERTVVSALIEARYPDIAKSLVPEGAALTVERDVLLEVLSRLETVTGRERFPFVDLAYDGDVLSLSGQREGGEIDDAIDAFCDGEWSLRVNPVYLGGVAKAHDCEQVSLHSKGPMAPVIVTSDDERLISLVMPTKGSKG